jgi:hypothetical protein
MVLGPLLPKPLHGDEDRRYPDQVVGALRGRSRRVEPHTRSMDPSRSAGGTSLRGSLGRLQGARVVGWQLFTRTGLAFRPIHIAELRQWYESEFGAFSGVDCEMKKGERLWWKTFYNAVKGSNIFSKYPELRGHFRLVDLFCD